jgi:hypothetical protein
MSRQVDITTLPGCWRRSRRTYRKGLTLKGWRGGSGEVWPLAFLKCPQSLPRRV